MSELDTTAWTGCRLHRGGLRALCAAFGAALLLGLGFLPGCVGPGLEPPDSEGNAAPDLGGDDVGGADGGVTGSPNAGASGDGAPSSGTSGAGGRGAVSGGTGGGGNGGEMDELDAGFEGGIDEDAGALR